MEILARHISYHNDLMRLEEERQSHPFCLYQVHRNYQKKP